MRTGRTVEAGRSGAKRVATEHAGRARTTTARPRGPGTGGGTAARRAPRTRRRHNEKREGRKTLPQEYPQPDLNRC